MCEKSMMLLYVCTEFDILIINISARYLMKIGGKKNIRLRISKTECY